MESASEVSTPGVDSWLDSWTRRRRSLADDLAVHLVLAPAVLDLEDPDVGVVLHLPLDIGVGLGLADRRGAGAAAPGRLVARAAGLGEHRYAFLEAVQLQ